LNRLLQPLDALLLLLCTFLELIDFVREMLVLGFVLQQCVPITLTAFGERTDVLPIVLHALHQLAICGLKIEQSLKLDRSNHVLCIRAVNKI